jgi:hypothetical protein
MRPTEEYRPATDTEWVEFEEHFDKRKVELGTCGRPYATPCTHEHSCIRCPMLHVDPKMITRLDEIEEDLRTRRLRAEAEGWIGEMEGIEITLTFLHGTRSEGRRLDQRTASLGIPTFRKVNERPATTTSWTEFPRGHHERCMPASRAATIACAGSRPATWRRWRKRCSALSFR